MHADRVLSRIVPEPNSGCWLWTGAHDAKGYGFCRYPRDGINVVQNAHRVVYEIERGPIPNGLDLDHLCRNSACVNPDHLEPVSRSVNVRRGNSPHKSRLRWLGNQLRAKAR
jgi:hypothetical protein